MSEKERMHKRVDDYLDAVLARVARVHRAIDDGKHGGEDDREWLDQFAKGTGFDVCAGDMPIRDAMGVDISYGSTTGKLAPLCYVKTDGADLGAVGGKQLDFVVTNYFDCFPSPLQVLNEWHRVLKDGGRLALVCANAETYSNARGPLNNVHRFTVQTPTTIKFYLQKVGFKEIEIVTYENSLRVTARKREPWSSSA